MLSFELISIKIQNLIINKNILNTIFEELRPQDKVALLSIARRVNIIYSLTSKNKNTIQLCNQLKHIESADEERVFVLKALIESLNLLSKNQDKNKAKVLLFYF